LAAVFLSAMLGATMARAQEPVDVLAKNGLTKSGTFFVIASEQPVLQKLYNLQPVINQMQQKYMAVAAIYQNEYEYHALKDYQIEVEAHLSDVRRQVNSMNPRTPQDRQTKAEAQQYQRAVEQELRATNTQVERRRSLLVGPAEKARAERDFKERRDAFVKAKSDMWPMVDETMKQYDQLKENDSVKNALRAYNQEVKAHLKVGPSDKFTKGAKQVISCERNFSPETASQPKRMPKRKGLQMKKKK
jgi:hypothetical protein